MKVAMPHMGHIYVPLRTLFREVGVEMVVPPLNSRRTLTLGAKHSPEFVCIPFKLTLGNFIEALEMGADTLVMAAGPGLCRFGYYAKIQERILRDQGYHFEMVTTELFESKLMGVANLVKRLSNGAPTQKVLAAIRFGLAKLGTLDELERVLHQVRATEAEKGSADQVFQQALAAIDGADSRAALKEIKNRYLMKLQQVERDGETEPVVVGITGEFYVVLEPFSNMDLERELGRLGAEVRRTTFVSEWMKFSLFLNAFGLSEKDRIHQAAAPYLRRDVGGDGWESVGDIILHSHDYDGLIHVAPFTCGPEIIAQNIFPAIKTRIPVLTVICDEQMGRAGMLTRLEAFVELLRRRRARKGLAVAALVP
ncbi:MAG: CoA protein activase [Chloroflexi bacterium]|nr:CoA protein activase [Chloroflexota bacterium]